MSLPRKSLLFVALLVFLAGCGDDDPFGQIAFTWSIQGQTSGRPFSCAPGDVVRLRTTTTVDLFDCDLGSGVTSLVPPGTTVATFELLTARGEVLSTVDIPMAVIDGEVADAGHIVFLVRE